MCPLVSIGLSYCRCMVVPEFCIYSEFGNVSCPGGCRMLLSFWVPWMSLDYNYRVFCLINYEFNNYFLLK